MVLAMLSETAPVVLATCTAGVAFLLLGVWGARKEVAPARGSDKIAALGSLCIAVSLAVFGAEHLFGVELVVDAVPKFMPWRLFWAYFVGVALLAAALSIATKVAVRWAGLFLGLMMFLFVAMIDLRGLLAHPQNRIFWALTLQGKHPSAPPAFASCRPCHVWIALPDNSSQDWPHHACDHRNILWHRALSPRDLTSRSAAGKGDAGVDSRARAD